MPASTLSMGSAAMCTSNAPIAPRNEPVSSYVTLMRTGSSAPACESVTFPSAPKEADADMGYNELPTCLHGSPSLHFAA
eukprot:CAMPEP_0198710154 /NCGR_PEP_ID=MMETSP1471-20131121/2499_1 /TAXON_ID=41880 /ORGANISM="Pycnococcus provasolii, Strain RCC733" /LENGTH=78 /DNA_ID=CAMNT_0044469747 /DNA_START=172 /DNA_END=408 /DNA_ORIENTATION=+